MEQLGAPWRIKFIQQKVKYQTCIFCIKSKINRDKANFVLYRGKYGFIILNVFPYTNGHLMVAPYRHCADLELLSPQESAELFELMQLGVKLLKQTVKCTGLNIGMNIGKPGGAGVADHIHIHLVPRWVGDTNFMPVTAKTKVLPESLPSVYARMIKTLKQLHPKK